MYFPGKYTDTKVYDYYTDLKDYTLQLCAGIQGKDTRDRVRELEIKMLTFVKPMAFGGSHSADVRFMKTYEDACIIIQKHLNRSPKDMTVIEFLNALEDGRKSHKSKRPVRR